jgi:hypothetical protein
MWKTSTGHIAWSLDENPKSERRFSHVALMQLPHLA